jgi:phage/conjugal plasmid C-4 type zinc finger TraR family protein
MTPEDRAQALELAEYERIQARAIQPAPATPSAKYCTDATCGERIPEARRAALPGVLYCAACQERREHAARRTRGPGVGR